MLLDSDFVHLKEIVSEGRMIISNIERVSSLYLTKTIYSLLLNVIFYLIGTFLSVCADSSDTDQYGGHRYSKFYSGIRTDRDCTQSGLP